ncbi:bifunctional 2-polyprenyl-6-hydroxyphenol methylase/3-demethylubiquinol 3-O-methyltransferase UbiG [Streptomyces sp. XD-27]|uniref:class I SAM-dependent methyltransferase n=1 Tax=Streptomyces sp. XD-27 TaxID=3062779 RepID=UPI0026F43EE8|nr:class I SAM-dependent methyltransferase [Streptomyces sp. XD-27]WKX74196.1 class I SAM-dependent methyltransferase [Streptomyces sp. XD-27]
MTSIEGERSGRAEREYAPAAGAQPYYAEAAEALAEQYESVTFEDVHGEVRHLLPHAPARVADIGSGTGRDAAALARRGYDVVAVEPVAELRRVAQRLHAEEPIAWLEDSLPGLARLSGPFDLILLSAVWMHMDQRERGDAMPRLCELLAPGGRLVVSLRHGPPPEGRRMFDVPADETTALAERHGLRTVYVGHGPDHLGRGDVHWTELVLERPA